MSQIGSSPSRMYRPGIKPPVRFIIDVDVEEVELRCISRMLQRRAARGADSDTLDFLPGDFE